MFDILLAFVHTMANTTQLRHTRVVKFVDRTHMLIKVSEELYPCPWLEVLRVNLVISDQSFLPFKSNSHDIVEKFA
jgi:hypothetical protein